MQRFPLTLLASALALISSTVQAAQPVQPQPAASAPQAPSATAPQAAAVDSGAVNPFVGTALTVEHARQQLELAKLRTQLKQEEVAYKNAETDLAQLPKKREADLKKTLASASQGMGGYPAMPGVTVVPEKKAAKPKSASKPAATAPVAVTPQAPRVEVLGVVKEKGDRLALLSIGGNVMSVKSGQMTPMGVATLLSDTQVSVGGEVYNLHTATLARQVVPQPPAASAGTRGSPGTLLNPVSGMGSAIPVQSRFTARTPILPPGLSAN